MTNHEITKRGSTQVTASLVVSSVASFGIKPRSRSFHCCKAVNAY